MKAIRDWKNESFGSYLSSLAPTKKADYSLWVATKKLRLRMTYKSTLRNKEGYRARNDRDKAELLGRYFESTIHDDIPATITIVVWIQDDASTIQTSPIEVTEAIDQLNRRKSAGPNEVIPVMICELPPRAIIYLTYLFNADLRLHYEPTAWKKAKMIGSQLKSLALINLFRCWQ